MDFKPRGAEHGLETKQDEAFDVWLEYPQGCHRMLRLYNVFGFIRRSFALQSESVESESHET